MMLGKSLMMTHFSIDYYVLHTLIVKILTLANPSIPSKAELLWIRRERETNPSIQSHIA